MNNTGDRIRKNIVILRDQRGLNDNKLAIKAGISRSTLSGIMKKPGAASVSNIEMIADGLGVSLSRLLEDPENTQEMIRTAEQMREVLAGIISSIATLDDLKVQKALSFFEIGVPPFEGSQTIKKFDK